MQIKLQPAEPGLLLRLSSPLGHARMHLPPPLLINGCRGLEVVRKCCRVYLEAYTSILMCDKSKLVSSYRYPVLAGSKRGSDFTLSAAIRHSSEWP